MNGLVAVVEVTVVCVKHHFLSFLRNIFPEMAAHSKGAMIVSLFFTVDTLQLFQLRGRVDDLSFFRIFKSILFFVN